MTNRRTIDYLRISVTDRCNLRCVYCMPEGGCPETPRHEILSYEEIVRVAGVLSGVGIRHLRVTGGEPMVRPGCLDLVRRLRGLPGIESVSMTSNGQLLYGRIAEARDAGLSALNLSIDSLCPETYARLTRGGCVRRTLDTLFEAIRAGLPVKINAVPLRGVPTEDWTNLAELAREYPVRVRFIELMPIGRAQGLEGVPQREVMERLSAAFGPLRPDKTPYGHGPAVYYRPDGFAGSIGFISAVTREFCGSCNRLRLTADGFLKLCLNRAGGLDLRGLLRGGADNVRLETEIREAIARKPERHGFFECLPDRETRTMNGIGG